jgi:predicted porin
MKKTLIALAALAAFGSASAEVTLYGKVDVGLSNTTTTGGTDQGLQVLGNNYETSRFGIKGGADLTGGVKAIFQLEEGFKLGDGSNKAANSTFNRVSMAGLTGSFGTVSAGLQWSPYDSAWGWDALEYNGFSAANTVFYSGAHGDNGTGNGGFGNVKNSIQYTTPDIAGFNASIMYANGADKTATTDATKYIGVGANYVAGPLNVNFGYESVPSSIQQATFTASNGTVFTPAQGDKTGAYIIGASYNLGVATVGGAFEQANVDYAGGTAKDSGYTFGVSFPVSKQTTLAASYAKETTTLNGASDGTATGFGAQVIYNWTAQMAVYGGVVQSKKTVVSYTAETTSTTYAAGLRYNF